MTAPESPSSGSPFWRFSLRFYRQREVADACIALQEEAGVDVNLLLFLLWHATQKRTLSPAQIAELERRIAPWRDTTVILEAERLQQEAMHGLAVPSLLGVDAPSLEAAARANIAAYAAMRSAAFPASATETLLAALAGLERNPEE